MINFLISITNLLAQIHLRRRAAVDNDHRLHAVVDSDRHPLRAQNRRPKILFCSINYFLTIFTWTYLVEALRRSRGVGCWAWTAKTPMATTKWLRSSIGVSSWIKMLLVNFTPKSKSLSSSYWPDPARPPPNCGAAITAATTANKNIKNFMLNCWKYSLQTKWNWAVRSFICKSELEKKIIKHFVPFSKNSGET